MELSALTLDFEGTPLTTLTVNGRPAWIAREIGVRRAVGATQRLKTVLLRYGVQVDSVHVPGV